MQEVADHFKIGCNTCLLHSPGLQRQPSCYLQCSTDTIRSRLQEGNESYHHHLPRQELLGHISAPRNINTDGRAWGHRQVQSTLTYYGIRAPPTEVLEALRQHHPIAVVARRERILHRSTYDITDAMALWHIDSVSPCFQNFATT